MKRIPVAALIIALLLSLVSCELRLTKTVQYNISGNSDSLAIRYQDKSHDIVSVTASSPWSIDFELWSSQRPFLAFIRVDNGGTGDVSVYILEDDSTKASGTATAGGPTIDLYALIE